MNTALKHWKEAATLILAAGHRLGADGLSLRTPASAAPPPSLDRSQGRSHQPHEPSFDYDVLMLKRSSKSGFMPNAYVFPGGLIDSSDFSSEWLDIFQQFANTPNFGLRSVKQRLETRPPIFATDRLKLGSPIPGEVAFRICALRETFEESGVLLVVSQPEMSRLSKSVEDMSAFHQVLDNRVNKLCIAELSRWRTRVIENPSNFIRMCKELQVLPNIWALHEWSNWLTPVGRYGMSRFDTAFFICCLPEIPQTRQDEKEIVKFQVINLSHYAHALSYFSRLNVDLLDSELGQKPPILLTGLDRQSGRVAKTQRLSQNKIPPNFVLCVFVLIGNKNMLDNTHPVSFQWSTPSEILQGFQAQDLWIAPPQFYELSRMCRFPLLSDLHNFSSKRATEGCEHWLPVHSNDEHNRPVSLLPGIKCLSRQFGSLRVLLKHAMLYEQLGRLKMYVKAACSEVVSF